MYVNIFFILLHAYVVGFLIDGINDSIAPQIDLVLIGLNTFCLMGQYGSFQLHLQRLKGNQK